MTELEMLIRDIETLRDSIKLNSMNLHQLAPNQIKKVLEHTAWCIAELRELESRLQDLCGRASA